MELLLSNPLSNLDLAAKLVAEYSGLIRSEACKVHLLNATTAAALNLKLPVLVTTNGTCLTQVSLFKCLAMESEAKDMLLGTSAFFKAEVEEWVQVAGQNQMLIQDSELLKILDEHLKLRTFFVKNHVSLADLLLFCSILPWVKNATNQDYITFHHVVRWFNHIRNLPGLDTYQYIFNEIKLLEDAPAPAPAETSKPKSKKSDSKAQSKSSNSGSKVPSTPVSSRPIDDVTRLEIRVGLIKKVWKHENSENLYCEEIDIGEEKPRSICSGLVKHMKDSDLLHAKVLVLANLKPRSIRGFTSQGMVLCASSTEGNKVEILRPPASCSPGELIQWEGLTGEPDAQMSEKSGKNPFAAVQPFLKTDACMQAFYKEFKFTTSAGPCVCDSIKHGNIS